MGPLGIHKAKCQTLVCVCLETTVAELRAGMHGRWKIEGFLWNILGKGGLSVTQQGRADVSLLLGSPSVPFYVE